MSQDTTPDQNASIAPLAPAAAEPQPGSALENEKRLTPDYAALAQRALSDLSSEQKAVEMTDLALSALKSGDKADSAALIVSTAKAHEAQRAAWHLAAQKPEFDLALNALLERVIVLAEQKSEKKAVSADRLSALLADMEDPELSEPEFGESEFGVWIKRERELPGLRFLIGKPDFTIHLSVLTRESWLSERMAAVAKRQEAEIEPNESPILAPNEKVTN